jgi:hypothetical protein
MISIRKLMSNIRWMKGEPLSTDLIELASDLLTLAIPEDYRLAQLRDINRHFLDVLTVGQSMVHPQKLAV